MIITTREMAIARKAAAGARLLRGDIDEPEICKRYKTGLSMTKLKNQFGVAEGTIKQILEKNKVVLRSRSEARRLANL